MCKITIRCNYTIHIKFVYAVAVGVGCANGFSVLSWRATVRFAWICREYLWCAIQHAIFEHNSSLGNKTFTAIIGLKWQCIRYLCISRPATWIVYYLLVRVLTEMRKTSIRTHRFKQHRHISCLFTWSHAGTRVTYSIRIHIVVHILRTLPA